MGARPAQVIIMTLAEAALITGLGGLAGLIPGMAALLSLARSLGYYNGLLGVAFSWPPLPILELTRSLPPCCRPRSDLPEPSCRRGGRVGPRRSA